MTITDNVHLFKFSDEKVEQCAKSVQSLQLKHQENVTRVVLASLLLTLSRLYTLFRSFIVHFEQVNSWWL